MRQAFKNTPQTTEDGIVIFLDMDGVVSDYDGHAVATGVRRADGSDDEARLDRAWWASMPAFPGAKAFHLALKKLAPVTFLTAPKCAPDCFGGKADWMLTFSPERRQFAVLDLMICWGQKKFLLATPQRILVDDRQKNIDEWVGAGGVGILHEGDFAKTLKKVEQAIAALRAPAQKPAPKAPGPQ